MGMFRKKTPSDIAVERLKLVLIHDRMDTSPDRNIITKIKRDIIKVISDYVEIDIDSFDVEIKQNGPTANGYETRLTANIPIKRIK